MLISIIIFWGGLVSMLLLSIIIGSSKRTHGSSDWMSANRNMGLFATIGSIIGTMIGGAIFTATVVMGYENGIVGIYIGLAYAFGLFMLGLYSEKIIHLLDSTNSETLFHFVVQKLGKNVGKAYSIVSIFLFTMAASGQVLAMRYYFIDMPGIKQSAYASWGAIIISVIVVIIYTYWGGLYKDMMSDCVQLIYMIIGICIVIPYIYQLPAAEILTKLDKKMYTVGAYGPIFLIGAVLLVGPMLFVRADLWQRIRAAKSPRIARISFYISAPIVALSYCFFTYLGMLARGLDVKSGSNLIVGILMTNQVNKVQPWIISGLSVAFIGAVISTLDSLLNLSSIAFVRAINPGMGKDESTVTSLKHLKLALIFIVVCSIVVLMFFSNIVDVFVGAVSFVMILAPPIFHLLLNEDQVSKRGTFYCILISSMILIIGWFFIPKIAFVPAVIAGWLIYFIFLLIERFPPKKHIVN